MNKLKDFPELHKWFKDSGFHSDPYKESNLLFSQDDVQDKLIAMATEIVDLKRKLKRSEPVPMFKMHDMAYFEGSKVRIIQIETYCHGCNRFLDEPMYTVLIPYYGKRRGVKEPQLKLLEE